MHLSLFIADVAGVVTIITGIVAGVSFLWTRRLKQPPSTWVQPSTKQQSRYIGIYRNSSTSDDTDHTRRLVFGITVAAIGALVLIGPQIMQTVSENNLQATAIASVNPYPSYLPGKGTFALYDLLRDNNSGNSWDENARCIFTGGAYHVNVIDTHSVSQCAAGTSNFSNFAFEIQMRIIKGNCGGMMFRGNSTNSLVFCQAASDG